jgi:hypothetical protein
MSVPKGVFYMHEYPDFEFGLTSRAFFGMALVEALKRPEETKNKHMDVHLARLSQNRALQLTREALPNTEIKVIPASCDERYQQGMAKLAAGEMDELVFADIFSKCIFDPETNTPPDLVANDSLGLRMLTDEEMKDLLVATYASTRY